MSMGQAKIKVQNYNQVLEYWNQNTVESMYDKNLLNLEIDLIKKRIPKKSKILDAGCGEGEGTLEYSKIPQVLIHAVDFSDTRLKKASKRLIKCRNIFLKKINFLADYSLDNDYDIIISQRFLINLMGWKLQKKVLADFKSMLKKGGKLILLEGSINGVKSLNHLRGLFGLKEIPVKWHNLFINDNKLIKFMESIDMSFLEEDGLGEYFILTRGIKPIFEKDLSWDNQFNRIAASLKLKEVLNLKGNCSRLKLWVFKKS